MTEGQVLLQIDPREYRAQVDQARALLDVVKAEANSAELVIALLVLLWIWMGHVTTDDAQVACHITAVAPQVPGYVVQLMISDHAGARDDDQRYGQRHGTESL